MYKILDWTPDLDLQEFYTEAENKGFTNNSSQKVMIDCFLKEEQWKAWILYQDDRAVGSVVAHTFADVMGPDSYRVLARTCTFGSARPNGGLITPKKLIAEHQNLTDQFLLPRCLEWVGDRGTAYATSNPSKQASQRLVHKYYFPTLEKLNIVEKIKDVEYRGLLQTVWKINRGNFLTNLEKYPRWT
jgi:hypothetical protein